ncbi:phospholipase D-like domain-containing protein [Candidatus Omnitrophota bacterium]
MDIVKKIFVSLLISVFFATSVFAFEAYETDDLSGEKYFEKVREVLEDAEEEIFVVMYIIEMKGENEEDLIFKLCRDLVEAEKRGVEVRVIMEADIKKNEYAYHYLDKNAVDVSIDISGQYKHDKGIVVDRKWVVAGSTNWTEAALRYNSETTVLVNSPDLAESILARYARIKTKKEDKRIENILTVPIERVFLENHDLGARLLKNNSNRAFDLYLFLLYQFDGNKEGIVEIDYEKTARYLGLKIEKGLEWYRRQIRRELQKLQDRYKLIEYRKIYGKEPIIKLLDWENREKAYSIPEGHYFQIPYSYWEDGYPNKLSFSAKYCLLINFYEATNADEYGWWSFTRGTLNKRFGISKWAISKGMNELKDKGIISIWYGKKREGDKREPNKYKLTKFEF